jgi:cytochrome c oxidase assembly factor CtaG
VNVLLGVLIALADQPIYTYYLTVPRLGGLTVMQDQMLGGALMWVVGGMMYIMAAVILLVRLFRAEARLTMPADEPTNDNRAWPGIRQV